MKTLAPLFVAITLGLFSQSVPPERVGPLAGGGYLVDTGWRVKPAGVQIALDTFPMSVALSPDGRFLVVLHAGQNRPSLIVLDAKSLRELQRVPLADAWLGVAFSPNGRLLWVSGASQASILEFSVDEGGKLQPTRTFELVKAPQRTGLDFIGDVAVSPDGRLLYACDLFHDTILVVNPQSGIVIERFKTGRRPYRILFHPDGKTFYVTSWADGSLHRHQASNGSQLQVLRLGAHPTDMVWRDRATTAEDGQEIAWKARIFVSAANTNNVYSVGVSESGELRMVEAIHVATTPNHPLGMTPSALALSPDQSRLYAVCSGENAVAVIDVTEARSRMLGFIPAGWYPTAAKILSDGRLTILNGKGGGAMNGSASIIAPVSDETLQSYTAEVLANSPYSDARLEVEPEGLPPIDHVIYIVKEGRTFDEVLGDIGKGASDASFCLACNTSPNQHKLARQFVLFDNFYSNGGSSADGVNWSTAAISNDYVEKLWPSWAGGRRNVYDFEGGEPAAYPPAGYFWNNAAARGLPIRNYGFWVANRKMPGEDGIQVESILDPVLARITNLKYRGPDSSYTDVQRVQVFLEDLKQFESSRQMPALILMRLGGDPSSFADSDQALGSIVESVSRSSFWKTTAIFVAPAGNRNGRDHIAPQRSVAFLISPYTRRGSVDSGMYNSNSVLRTMEMILRLRPMTQFDAAARPMTSAFSKDAVLTAYEAEKPGAHAPN